LLPEIGGVRDPAGIVQGINAYLPLRRFYSTLLKTQSSEPERCGLITVAGASSKATAAAEAIDLDDRNLWPKIYTDLTGFIDGLAPYQRAGARQIIQKDLRKYLENFGTYMVTLSSQERPEAPSTYSASFKKYMGTLNKQQLDALRDTTYANYSRYLDTLPPDERLQRRETFTRARLNRLNISVADLKRALDRVGYKQPVNDQFDTQLTDTIILLQKDHGFEPDGICGEICLGKLTEMMRAVCGVRSGQPLACAN
jgi:Putative peptidoglycan binding domain